MQMPSDWTQVIAAVSARTVHVSVLPFDTTIEKLGVCFSQHGAVNQVRLLKYADMGGTGCFRGCALVEMSSIEEASMILSNSMEYEGSVLRVQSKADYEEAMAKVCASSSLLA